MESQRGSISGWSYQRRSFVFWGALALLATILALALHPWFLVVTAFAGGGLILIHEQKP